MREKATAEKIAKFLRNYFSSAKKRTAIVGLSGGLDSAVTLCLCARALGKRRVLPVILPSGSTPGRDVQDAKALVSKLGLQAAVSNIEPALESFGELSQNRLSRANLSARIRMAILYSIAQRENGLVVGTGDKSEFALGYFTKYGDGGADLFPIGGIYKTEAKKLGKFLRLPRSIITKPPSPALWKGQTAEAELGFSYETADGILSGIERGEKKKSLEQKYGKKNVRAVLKRMSANRHKLLPAPICNV